VRVWVVCSLGQARAVPGCGRIPPGAGGRGLESIDSVRPVEVTIRTYERRDAADVADVFYRSVREVALSDYTAEQVKAWVPGRWDAEQEHRRSGDGRLVLVAADESGHVVAFIDLEPAFGGPGRRAPALSAIPSLIRTAHPLRSPVLCGRRPSRARFSLPVTASSAPSGVAGAIGLRPWTRRPLPRIWRLWKDGQG
jgi:hypothetical protein